MNDLTRKIAGVVMATLLVTSGFATPVVAEGDASKCGIVDSVVYGVTFGAVDSGGWGYDEKDSHCAAKLEQSILSESEGVQNIRESDDNQTKMDMYVAAQSLMSQKDTYLTTRRNYLNDSEAIAWMAVERAIANAFQEGKSKAEAKIEGKQAIADYYSRHQQELKKNWNNSAYSLYYIQQRIQNESGIPNDYIGGDDGNYYESFSGKISPRTTQMTYVNGTTTNVVWLRAGVPDGTNSNVGLYSKSLDGEGYPDYIYKINPPTNDYGEIVLLSSQANYDNANEGYNDWAQVYESIENKNSKLQGEVDGFVNNTWTALEEDRISASDLISRNNYVFQMGVEGTGNNSYSNMIAAYAAMGLETPNLNDTGTITIDYANQSLEGMLYSNNVPNGTWIAGTTYNASNITGNEVFITTKGERFELEGEFTITRIVSKSGEEQESVNSVTYNYVSSNESELRNKLDMMLKLIEEQEERETEAVGGGGGGSGDSSTPSPIDLPDWLEAQYLGIPLWGILMIGSIGAYAISSVRGKN